MEELKASVIVLTWNGSDYIEACLASILAQDYGNFEVIVVDNGSTDGTPELVSERFPKVRLIRNGRNLGFAAGNNAGLRAAGGDLLAAAGRWLRQPSLSLVGPRASLQAAEQAWHHHPLNSAVAGR